MSQGSSKNSDKILLICPPFQEFALYEDKSVWVT